MTDEGVSLGSARLIRSTAMAILVVLEDRKDQELWIPKSQIHDDSEVYDAENPSGELVVTSWFANKQGLN